MDNNSSYGQLLLTQVLSGITEECEISNIPKCFKIAKVLQFNSKQKNIYHMTRYNFPRNWIL